MNWWKWLLSLIALMLTAATAVIFTLLYLSLPQYEGEQRSGIADAARLERDALGYLSIHAANRNDAAFALGFTHGQERFFQMDLLRRSAAGELRHHFVVPAQKVGIAGAGGEAGRVHPKQELERVVARLVPERTIDGAEQPAA